MPEDHDDDLDLDDGAGGDSLVRLPRKDIRALEKKGKMTDDLQAKNAQLERDLAFARAGIDTSTDEGAFFARGYAGELDVDAIKATAAKFGVLTPAATTPATPADPAPSDPAPSGPALAPGEADLTAQRQALHQGAAPDTGVDHDPYDQALALGRRVLEDGGDFKHAFGTAINSLVNAAHRGDQRAIIPSRSVQALGGS